MVAAEAGETFICVDCQADAKQFIEIQDAVWGPAGDTHEVAGEPSNEAQKPEQP